MTPNPSDPERIGELLPCPFCGGLAKTYQYNGTLQAKCAADYAACAGSDVEAPIAMWNRRAAKPADRIGELEIGQRVEKFTGDYQLPGVVRSIFETSRGARRYVVEHDAGFVHIYNRGQLRAALAAQPTVRETGEPTPTVRDVTLKMFKIKEHEQRKLIGFFLLHRTADPELKDWQHVVNAVKRAEEMHVLAELNAGIESFLPKTDPSTIEHATFERCAEVAYRTLEECERDGIVDTRVVRRIVNEAIRALPLAVKGEKS